MLYTQEDKGVQNQKKIWADRLISQNILWPKVNQTILTHHFPHFSLLIGKPGNGQLVLALSIAQTLLCKSEEKPCGICDACYKVLNCIHPDLHFSFPLNNPKDTCQQHYSSWRKAIAEKPFMTITEWFSYLDGESKNANISVTEINNFSSLLYLKPFEANANVLILWLPEYLGKDSNRLLKILEEPPANVFIILVTENCDLLLPTVLSRAQVYRMQSIQLEEAAHKLTSVGHVDYNTAYSVLLSCNGNIQEALLQMEHQNIPSIDVLRKLLQSAFVYNVAGMIEWVEHYLSLNKEDQKNFLQWIQMLLSFVLKLKFTDDKNFSQTNNSMIQYAAKLSNTLTISQIELWTTLIDDTYIALQRNANVKILITNFSIRLSHILKNLNSNN